MKDDSVMREFVTLTTTPPPDRQVWLPRFQAEGFTLNGERPEPGQSLSQVRTLYRGSSFGRRGELSWTSSRGVAIRWATHGANIAPEGRCWMIDKCPPGAILATWTGRQEFEYIVDTDQPGVVIREWAAEEIAEALPFMQRSEDYGVTDPRPILLTGHLKSNKVQTKSRAKKPKRAKRKKR
jgi:hypothetical protein